MATKEKKSAAELKALIMREVKQHPEWHDIVDVAITQPARPPHQPNWDAAFTMSGRDLCLRVLLDLPEN
jgi:hypothetical protein